MDVSPRKLQSLRCIGAIPYSKIDRKVYYKKADVMQYMESILKKEHQKQKWDDKYIINQRKP